jgi:hypothetical protein
MNIDNIHIYIYATICIAVVGTVLSIIALVKRGPKGDKGDSGDKGDIGASGKPGIQGPAGPAGIMTVKCSSGTGQGNQCSGTIPTSLVVDGLTVNNTLQVGDDADYKWDANGIQLGSPSNSWTPSGNITATGDLVVGSPSNMWSSSGDITTSGDLIVGSPSNKITSSPSSSHIYNLEIGNGFSATAANATFYAVTLSGDVHGNGGNITASGDIILGSPTNSWSSSGVITTTGDIKTNGNVTVGSPSNTWTNAGAITTSGDLTVGNGNTWTKDGVIKAESFTASAECPDYDGGAPLPGPFNTSAQTCDGTHTTPLGVLKPTIAIGGKSLVYAWSCMADDAFCGRS